MKEDDVIKGIEAPGRFDATVASEATALRIIRRALPQAVELPPAVAGRPYPSPLAGIKAWYPMSVMFEVYYKPPMNLAKESTLTKRVAALGGRFDFREEPDEQGPGGVCLTYEFDDWQSATKAADLLRRLGEHVEGPVDYGPSN